MTSEGAASPGAPLPAATPAASFPLAPLPQTAPFSGRIALTVTRPSQDPAPASMTLYVGTHKARWDVPGGYRVYDADQRRLFSVDETQHMVHTSNETELDAAAEPTWTMTPDPTTPTSTVSGYACDREQTQDDRFIYQACLAEGMQWLPLQSFSPALRTVVPFAPALRGRARFPLSVVVRQIKGSGIDGMHAFFATYQVQKIDRGRVPDAAFALPAYPSTPATPP
jgi:hypothetical protein